MIITVTLNAAIDKTLAVPNFRIGRRHRSTEQRTMAGRQGRQRRARAQDARPAGDRDRSRRRADRHAHQRAAHRGGDPQRLRSHPRRVANLDGGDRPHDRRADRDKRARPRGRREAELSLFREKLLYLAKGADICVFAGSLPREVEVGIYAELIGELSAVGVTTVVDSEGEPMERALRASPDLVSPNAAEAEALVGHEFRDEQDHIYALYELCELGAREAIITDADGCHALIGRDRERALYSVRADPLEPVSAIGAGDVFLAGYLAATYMGRGPEQMPALRRRMWRRVDAALRRRRAGPARGRAHRGRGAGRQAGRARTCRRTRLTSSHPGERLSRRPPHPSRSSRFDRPEAREAAGNIGPPVGFAADSRRADCRPARILG